MKNAVRVMSVALVVVMLGALLVSCGTMFSGEYSREVLGVTTTYEFKFGGKLIVTTESSLLGNNTIEGTYKIDGDEIIITTTSGDKTVTDTHDFEKGDSYIKIDGVQYDKK